MRVIAGGAVLALIGAMVVVGQTLAGARLHEPAFQGVPEPSSATATATARSVGVPDTASPDTSLEGAFPGQGGRLLAVKIDNVGDAQYEQAGLNSADVVYVVQVEGGLSRYLVIFDSTHLPARIGPVRSARQTDIPLLAPYGKVGLAYSGAISGLLPQLASANLQNITPADGLFTNGGGMPTYIHPAQVFSAYPGLAQARNVGLSFGPEPPGGTPAHRVSAAMPAASFTFTAAGTSWLVWVDGHPAATTDQGQASATNVIIQHVAVVPGKFTDYNAAQPANEVFSQTTGQGEADLYRDGKHWRGLWKKPSDGSPTQYTVSGAPMTLAPGRTWVVLVGSST